MRLIDADVLMEKANEHYRLALKRTEEAPFNDRYREQAIEREKFLGFISNAPTVTIDNTGYSQGFKDGKECTLVSIDAIEDITDCMVSIISEIDWEKAIEAYKARPQGKWISVSERLPNICGVYNVTKRVIEGGRCYYIAGSCYFDGTETWHDDNRINFGRERVNCIIAWQPLPEPYKEAENDVM